MSLQTEALLSLLDRLDPEKQDEFIIKAISVCSTSQLTNLYQNTIPELLIKRREEFLFQLIQNLGFTEDFTIRTNFYAAHSGAEKGVTSMGFSFMNSKSETTQYSHHFNNPQAFSYTSNNEFETMRIFLKTHVQKIFEALRNYELTN